MFNINLKVRYFVYFYKVLYASICSYYIYLYKHNPNKYIKICILQVPLYLYICNYTIDWAIHEIFWVPTMCHISALLNSHILLLVLLLLSIPGIFHVSFNFIIFISAVTCWKLFSIEFEMVKWEGITNSIKQQVERSRMSSNSDTDFTHFKNVLFVPLWFVLRDIFP